MSLAAAREIQERNAEGGYYSGKRDRVVYEAVLYAAPDLPQDIGQLCLELAQRRDIAAHIVARVHAVRQKRAEERHQREERPPHVTPMDGFGFSRGRRRAPWPDGPRDRVDSEFMEACLAGDPFSALVHANPAVALEVLLAVCIENPKGMILSVRVPWTNAASPIGARAARQCISAGRSCPSCGARLRMESFSS